MTLTLLSQSDGIRLNRRGLPGRDGESGRDGIGFLGARERPGDVRDLFTSALSGKAETSPTLAVGAIVANANGAVLRVPGQVAPLIIASRQDFAVEEGQTYAARWAVTRAADTSDPFGDAVEFRLAWLDADKGYISTALATRRALIVSDGRFAHQATFSRNAGADITAPAGARYVRPYVRLLGGDGITDIEVIDRRESSGLPGPKGDVGAEPEYQLDVESEMIRWRQANGSLGPWLDIGSARKKAEAARDIAQGFASDIVSQGNVPIFDNRASAAQYDLSGLLAVVINRPDAGSALAPATYRPVAAQPVHSGRFQSVGGQWWEIAEGRPIPEQFGTATPFAAIEAYAKGKTIDLSGRTYEVASVPSGNVYVNGFFTSGGSTRSTLSFKEVPRKAPVFTLNGGGQMQALKAALLNPLKQMVGLVLIGDSITWGSNPGDMATSAPRDGTLSDPRNSFASACWANEFKRYIGREYANGAEPILANWPASPSGEAIATYFANEFVLPRYGDVTTTITGPSITLAENYGSGSVLNTQIRISDGSSGQSFGDIVFPFTGTTFAFVFGSNPSQCLDYELFVNEVSQGTFSTTAGVDGIVAGRNQERVHTFGYIRDGTIRIRTKRPANASGVHVLFAEAIRVPRAIRITNQGINGSSSRTYRAFNMTGNSQGDGVAVGSLDEFIICQLGTNDRGRSTSVASGMEFFKNNYRLLMADLQTYGKVICMAPSPARHDPAIYTSTLRDVRRVVREVAKERSLDLIDNYEAFADEDFAALFPDGLHPNRRGHALMARNVIGSLEAA